MSRRLRHTLRVVLKAKVEAYAPSLGVRLAIVPITSHCHRFQYTIQGQALSEP